MSNHKIAHRDVCDLAIRTEIRAAGTSLILWSQQDSKPNLSEPTPAVFHDIALEQHALSVLELKQVLDDEWISVGAANKSRLPFHPGQRLEHVVVANFNVCRRQCSRASSEHDVLPRGLKEIVHDLVRSHRVAANAAKYCLSISTRSTERDAMKIRKERIHDGDRGA